MLFDILTLCSLKFHHFICVAFQLRAAESLVKKEQPAPTPDDSSSTPAPATPPAQPSTLRACDLAPSLAIHIKKEPRQESSEQKYAKLINTVCVLEFHRSNRYILQ